MTTGIMPRFTGWTAGVLIGVSGAFGLSATIAAPPTPYDVINRAAASSPITVHRLRGGISMLEGSGGNIGVLIGRQGKLMVDCGIAVSRDKIERALAGLGPEPLRYAILTHWHWDHSDGDGWVRRTGATLIADRLAVQRLTQTNRIVEWGHTFTPIARGDLPNLVLTGDKRMHFNGETVLIRHYRPGHTDGDISVTFVRADILQTGDTFWNGMYPFIDYVTGGSIDGAIRAANANIASSGAHTLLIPGHGPVGDRKALVAFRDMLVGIRGRIAALKAQGKSLAQVQAAHPTADFDAKWGQSVIDGTLFTALVYRGV
jgi:glyoxylase-like metal-dependent hydrolase (beta-lactamase superfamily II)